MKSAIKSAMEADMKSTFGCLPPWWPMENTDECEKNLPVKDLDNEAEEELLRDLDDLSERINIDAVKGCQPACKRSMVNVNTLYGIDDYPWQALI